MTITIVALFAYKLFDHNEPRHFGGAELQLLLLSKQLAKRYEVKVQLVTRGQGAFREFETDGIHVYKLPYYKTRWRRCVVGVWDIFKILYRLRTDIYVQRGRGIETGITGLVSRLKKKPFLFMAAHMWDVDGSCVKREGFIMGRAYHYGLKKASFVTTQSKQQQEVLRMNYAIESQVIQSAHVIPTSIPNDKQGVLWIGRCEPWKNPVCCLELAEALPEVSITMVCPMTVFEEMYAEIKSRAEKLPNVRFYPSIPFQESEKLFSTHRIFVNTSEEEGFPNTFVQAFKWGTPVVSMRVNPDDILHQYKMGICAQNDKAKWIASVKLLYDDTKLWHEYSRNARRYAEENHDLEIIAEEFFDLLKNLSL